MFSQFEPNSTVNFPTVRPNQSFLLSSSQDMSRKLPSGPGLGGRKLEFQKVMPKFLQQYQEKVQDFLFSVAHE